MRTIFCLLCLGLLVDGDIQQEIVDDDESIFAQNEIWFSNILKIITSSNNSVSKGKQLENSDGDQVFEKAFLKRKLNPVIGSTNAVVTVEEDNETHARASNFSSIWKRESPHQPREASEDEVEMDETIYMTFNEKERKDGFKKTSPENNPYAVMIFSTIRNNKDRGVMCSGSLLTSSLVLTAAHCFNNPNLDEVLVYAGGDSLEEVLSGKELPKSSQLRKTKAYYKHPNYNRKVFGMFDIAVVKVEEAFELTKTVNLVKITKGSRTLDKYKACMLTAFGKVFLKEADPEDNTRKTHYLEVKSGCQCVTSREGFVMCSRPREDYGACVGDSGGGLICNGVMVAVACSLVEFSNIDNCTVTRTDHCGVRNTLSVFQQTAPYFDWIHSFETGQMVNSRADCAIPNHRRNRVVVAVLVYFHTVLCVVNSFKNT